MRILYLNHNPAGTGTWQRASHFGRALAARGHDVTLLTTHPTRRFGFEDAVDEGGYREVRAPDLLSGPARTGWDPTNALRRVLHLRGQSFDLVHAFDARPVVIGPALEVTRRTGAALFLDWADWWGRGGRIQERSGWAVRTFFGPIETWFEEAFRTRAHGTTTISRALAERALALGVDGERLWTLPNGCDAEGVRPPGRAEARRTVGVPEETPLLLHVGVLTPADIRQLARAFGLLSAEVPEALLVFVGHHTAPLPPELLASGRVRTTGFVAREELNAWLGAADLCVVPLTDTLNNRGRWPGRINDYLAAGAAVVLPRVGDAAAVLEEHGAGWTCDPTPEALARSMLGALQDPAARARAGAAAHALAVGPLAWNAMAKQMEEAYTVVLADRSGSGRSRSLRGLSSRPGIATEA